MVSKFVSDCKQKFVITGNLSCGQEIHWFKKKLKQMLRILFFLVLYELIVTPISSSSPSYFNSSNEWNPRPRLQGEKKIAFSKVVFNLLYANANFKWTHEISWIEFHEITQLICLQSKKVSRGCIEN